MLAPDSRTIGDELSPEAPPAERSRPTGRASAANAIAVTIEPARQRPSLECLLAEAEALANLFSVSDPRGRLLQVALLRRDYTLIEAILNVQPRRVPPPRPMDKASDPQQRATLRPGSLTRRPRTFDKSAHRPTRAR